MPEFAQNSMLNYNPWVDGLQQIGQIGPAIAQGQYRGMELGLQRQRLQMDYALRQQEAQRMLLELQNRIAQQKEMQQYHQQQLGFGQQRIDEQRARDTQQKNEFAIKFHDTMMRHNQAFKGKWKLDTKSGIMYNDTTGEAKPIPTFSEQGGGLGQVTTPESSALGHILTGISQVPSMGTNAPPTLMPTLTNLLGRVSGQMMGQPQTNMPPQVQPQYRWDPQNGLQTNSLNNLPVLPRQ